MKVKYVFISIPVLLILLYTFNSLWTNNLKNTGIFARGRITSVAKISYVDNEKSRQKIEYYQVDISFVAKGVEIKGTKEMLRTEYDRKKLREGDMVTIIYDRKDPSEFILAE